MNTKLVFPGFSSEVINFLQQLQANNNRLWFKENKHIFKDLLEPAANIFVEQMTQNLQEIAEEPMQGKIFRIYRDVRFSKNNTPYDPSLRIGFTRLNTKQAQCSDYPMFYFSLQPDKLILACGLREFSKNGLIAYREAIIDNQRGAKLETLLNSYIKKNFKLDPPDLKNIPSGYDKDHPRENLLRRKKLAIWSYYSSLDNITTPNALKFCLEQYRIMQPIYEWLKILTSFREESAMRKYSFAY
ncbi:DUF2461 domain-containing protein [Rickettsia endosymbiont of Aspidapion aeneum]|uniref:DUF2461 domain-containing protein n=1 Tax=Rickettsia endosymbiont of Aspidapion aeneum TaxID=3066247 RepID=UPI00313DEE9E